MKKAYGFYLLLCVGIGIWVQVGKAHPDYLIGGFYGLISSWIGPGILLEMVTGDSHNMAEILGGSFVFWLTAGLIHKASRAKTRGNLRGPEPGQICLDPAPYPNNRRSRTSRTTRTYYVDEED